MLRLDMYMMAEVSQYVAVASFAEAWIEILKCSFESVYCIVASFAEAWIEILITRDQLCPLHVASFAEAWIEIYNLTDICICCRLLRGGVD